MGKIIMNQNMTIEKENKILKKGYKQTEIGVIPEDWEIKTLDKIGSFSKGNGVKKDESNSGYIPCIRYGEIYTKHSDYIKKFYSFISITVSENAKKLKYGDLLFAGSGETKEEIGKSVAFLNDFEAYAGGDIVILSPLNIDSLFFGFLLNYYNIVKQKANKGQGDAVVHITAKNLKTILVQVPKIEEQKAIAQALSDVDSLINSIEKTISKKRDIKTATMQQLLTGKKRLPKFESPWITTTILNFAPLQRGFDLTNSQLRNGLYPVVYSNGICNFHSKFMIKGPGIITGRSGTIGKVHYIEQNYWPHNTSLWVTNFKGNSPKFVYYLFSFIGLERFGSGSGVPTLNRNDVHSFFIKIPLDTEEQKAIAQILTDMDDEIKTLENKLEKTKLIKQGMMQELLTGKTRLL